MYATAVVVYVDWAFCYGIPKGSHNALVKMLNII